VLRGPQGIFKSTTWRTLASPDWFNDTPQANEKDLKLAIHTCWIYELAELDAVTGRKEAAEVKAVLSSPVDNFRPPYARVSEKHPRRSIMVATCNRDDFLRDETGSRRFWVIEVKNPINTDGLRDDRDRIWRAAVLAHRDGRQPFLSTHDQVESERRNLGYAPEHPWLGLLLRWMPSAPVEFTSDQALTRSGCVGDGRIERGHLFEAALPHVNVRIPGTVGDGDESRAGLHEPAGHDEPLSQTRRVVSAVGAPHRARCIAAVKLERVL
jgi:predicted P-loop ATPase